MVPARRRPSRFTILALPSHTLSPPPREFSGSRLVYRSVPWYIGAMIEVERVQTGVRMERRLLKVLKGLAEYLDLSLGDLLEGIVLHAFERKTAFDESTQFVIDRLRDVYGLELTAADSHTLCSSSEEDQDVRLSASPAEREHHRGAAPARRIPSLHSDR